MIHVDYDLTIDQLPRECIDECSGPGRADEVVAYWRKRLGFTVDRTRALASLAGYGAWERDELATWDDERIAETVLWLACGNFSEWDGTPESACGSDLYVLE